MPVDKVSRIARISVRLFSAIVVLILALTLMGMVGGKLFHGITGVPVTTATGGDGPPMILVVIGIGALGGFVGLQRRLKKLPDEDLHLLATSWLYALLSPLIGGVLGLVLYCLFISGLLAGDLFPRFCPVTTETPQNTFANLQTCSPVNVRDYTKLFFWSFLAGFSERFVVDIIGKFEHQAHDAPPPSPLDTAPAKTE